MVLIGHKPRRGTRIASAHAPTEGVTPPVPASRKKRYGEYAREAPPMLRNCSSAFDESTAAAETGLRVVLGRALSCVWGGVTTAWLSTLARRRRVAAADTTGAPDTNDRHDDFADDRVATDWLMEPHRATETTAHTATMVHARSSRVLQTLRTKGNKRKTLVLKTRLLRHSPRVCGE